MIANKPKVLHIQHHMSSFSHGHVKYREIKHIKFPLVCSKTWLIAIRPSCYPPRTWHSKHLTNIPHTNRQVMERLWMHLYIHVHKYIHVHNVYMYNVSATLMYMLTLSKASKTWKGLETCYLSSSSATLPTTCTCTQTVEPLIKDTNQVTYKGHFSMKLAYSTFFYLWREDSLSPADKMARPNMSVI